MTSPCRSHRQMRSAQLAWDYLTDDRDEQDQRDAAEAAQRDADEARAERLAEERSYY